MNTPIQNTTKYKNSPLGLIPEDWEVKKISDFGKVYTGNTPPTNDQENYGNEFMFVSPSDLGTTKYILNTEKRLSEKGFLISRKFESGSVLFTCIGSTIGKSGIAIEDLTSNQQINAITVNPFNNNEFLFYQLQRNSKQIKLLAGEQAVPILNKSQFEQIKLLTAPLQEQKAIADCLSTWDKAIEKQNALITHKELSKKALMQHLLSGKKRLKGFSSEWKKLNLGVDCELITKGTTPTSLGREFKDKGVNFIKIESLEENGTIIPNKVAFIDEQTHEMLKRSQLKENDILISIAGALGRVALVNKETLPANTNQALAIIRLKKESKLKLKYLYYFLNSPKVKKEIDAINVQAAQANLSLSNINDLTVLYPEIEEQTAIANVLQCADEELQLLKKKLEQLKEQKKGLMQVLLTGKKRLKY